MLKHKFKEWEIILEPFKKNTAAAIALSIIDRLPTQLLAIFPSDHLIENNKKFNSLLKKSKKFVIHKKNQKKDIFIFGVKPKSPSD